MKVEYVEPIGVPLRDVPYGMAVELEDEEGYVYIVTDGEPKSQLSNYVVVRLDNGQGRELGGCTVVRPLRAEVVRKGYQG